MPTQTRNKLVKTITLKPENDDFVNRYAAHRELSRSRTMDQIIEFYREHYDPTFRSQRRVGSAPRDLHRQ